MGSTPGASDVQRIDGQIVYSATDLVGFLACERLTELDRAVLAGLVEKPVRNDPELELIARRGREHERRFLAEQENAGRRATPIADFEGERRIPLHEAAAATTAALRRGDPLIYQAALFAGGWMGRADFLLRVEEPSDLGAWSYEVYDTKLAHHATAGAILQLALYSDLLAGIQGKSPVRMHVALGGSAHPLESHRVADYQAYYRRVKRLFEDFVATRAPAARPATRPDPVEHCDVCRWGFACAQERRRTDDLSRVAGITSRQRRGLREHGVATRRALAAALLPLPRIEGSHADSVARVREQARLQVEGEDSGRALYEILDPARTEEGALAPNLGLLALPEPSPGDLFLDMEGDPFAFEAGIDYLFGVIEPGPKDDPKESNAQPTFHAFWSRDADGRVSLAAEKRAFEALIDLVMERRARDPSLHVYHYASYEPAALGRLMGRHATRELEVDMLLRGDVLVDLYRAVRQGVRASVESYSIKKLEPLYGFERTVDLRDAGSSLVAFATWMETAEEKGGDEETLSRIAGYNRDDCLSNWRLRAWLEERRGELAARLGGALPRPEAKSGEASEDLSDHMQQVRDAEERLTAGLPDSERSPEQQARWLLAQLLSWHRREDKAAYWRYFYLRDDLTDEERIEEPEPIGGLTYVGVVDQRKRSLVHRYRFPAQEHDIGVGRQVTDPVTERSPGEVVAVDNAAGTIDLKRGADNPAPHPTSLVPELVVRSPEQQASLLRTARWVSDHSIDAPGPGQAGRELLLRRAPRVGQVVGAELATAGEPAGDAARRLVLALDGGCLAIQGPPGSGKTTIGAEMIVDLVERKRRVGVTANSHKVIAHLLHCVVEAAEKRGVRVRIGQKPGEDGDGACEGAEILDSNRALRSALAEGDVDVAGATAWAWSRPEFEGLLDTLFVDEAGQVSLANVLAVAPAGRNLVLLGDPQQLNQPLKGSHPPGAEKSALEHLLGDATTMPPDLGLFLDRTWRLHPDICTFTSEVFYDSRLECRPGLERQRVLAPGTPGTLAGSGVRYLPIVHQGNDRDSAEEADFVKRLVQELLDSGATWINAKGDPEPLDLEQILVVTPYNAQVRLLADTLPGLHVGTVDKFQGQQAPIAIYSMASSSAEDAPRGMEFLYSLNRLNVATSRARCVAVVVSSPELGRVRCRTPRQMRLANALCRFVELGRVAKD